MLFQPSFLTHGTQTWILPFTTVLAAIRRIPSQIEQGGHEVKRYFQGSSAMYWDEPAADAIMAFITLRQSNICGKLLEWARVGPINLT